MRFYWATVAGVYGAWLTFWLIMGSFAAWRQKVASDFFMAASSKNDSIGMQVGDESSHYFAEWITKALIWGGLWPLPILAALIVFGLIFKRIGKLS